MQFRPTKLIDMIGNDQIKDTINVTLSAAKEKNVEFPHSLIFAPAGTGKTTLASVIANEMGGEFKSYLSNVFRTKDDVSAALRELNQEGYDYAGKMTGIIKPSILFLDEVHQLSTKVQEAFFQAMEDFKFTGEGYGENGGKSKVVYWLPRFTLLAATTKAGMLDEAFISRFKLNFSLNLYTESELFKIILNWCGNFKVEITEEAIQEIAKRSRGVPRKALNLAERCRDTSIFLNKPTIDKAIVLKTFESLGIDSGGLENQDRQVLIYLYKIYPQKIGTARLAATLNLSENTLKEMIEPNLLRMHFIAVDLRGRQISNAGIKYCEESGLVDNKINTPSIIRRLT